ncbi:MAG TPA: EAL domain-containing protein, partial [Acidimicrobiales bacterium]
MASHHEQLFAATDVGLVVWEERASRFCVADSNAAARQLLRRPLSPGEAADRILDDPRLLLSLMQAVADGHDHVADDIVVDDRILQARVHPLGDGRVGLVVLDVTAYHEARRRIGHISRHDTLTGVGNRDEFLRSLDDALAQARTNDTRLAVIVLDLDRFKEVNDTLGHSQGDLLLAQVSRRLTALGDDLSRVCRVGGDEFALLATPTVATLESLAARVGATFGTPFPLGRLSIRVSASVGAASWPDHGDDAEELLRKADIAMWSAKQSGRGLAVYRPQDDRYNVRRLTLVSDLRDAIDRGDLALHYQPKLDLASGNVVGAEALVRWHHPDFGEVAPGEFVPLAEETALIGPLSRWVLGEAGRQLGTWRAAGIHLDVSANISARNLYDPRLVRWLTRLFDDHQLRSGQLTLELTETQVAEDLPMARQILRRLQAIGARLSIDDFGTGYSSLS